MNGYLQSKSRSQQQLMNELPRLVATRDLAGKKMLELLRELSFFYVSPTFATVPHGMLKDFCACLSQLKDKKDDLRIVRILFCFIARLVDVLEMRLQSQPPQAVTDARSQSFEQFAAMMTTLYKVIESNELTHASLPRQCTALKLYVHLCRLFGKSDGCFSRKIEPLVEKSPVWSSLGDKKKVKKEFPAQVAALSAAFHGVRFHFAPRDQLTLLQTLFQGCFLPAEVASICSSAVCNASITSRHAAATLLKLLTDDTTDTTSAQQVVEAFEWYFSRFKPATLLVGDVLASIYLIRLVGAISRLPVREANAVPSSPAVPASAMPTSASPNLLDFSFDPAPAPARISSMHKPQRSPNSSPRRNLRTGPPVDAALSLRAKELVLDVLCTPDNFVVPKAIVFVAIEEATKDQHAMECFEKTGRGPSRQGMCVYEIVAMALTRLLKQYDHAIACVSTGTSAALVANAGSTVLLHRICRSTRFVAETLDVAIVEMMEQDANNPRTRSSLASRSSSSCSGFDCAPMAGDGQFIDPAFLDKLGDKMIEFTSHVNEFTARESLLALVWLLPRQGSTKNAAEKWRLFLTLLESSCMVHPTRRNTIVDALLRRAAGISPQCPDVLMLKRTLSICLGWFFESPCEWHEAALVKIWQIALEKCFDKLGMVVFESIHQVLQFFRPHAGSNAGPGAAVATVSAAATLAAIQQVHHGTLHLLLQVSMQKCLLALVNDPNGGNSGVLATMLILQLMQMALCNDFATRRLAIQIVFGFGQLAFQSGNVAIHQMIASMLSNLLVDPAKKQFTREGLLLEDLLRDFAALETSSPPLQSIAMTPSTARGSSTRNEFIGTMFA